MFHETHRQKGVTEVDIRNMNLRCVLILVLAHLDPGFARRVAHQEAMERNARSIAGSAGVGGRFAVVTEVRFASKSTNASNMHENHEHERRERRYVQYLYIFSSSVNNSPK